MSPEVTVAVVSWNTRDLLRHCLSSLEPEHREGRADVWVIDNASNDGSPEMVRAEFPWVSLIAGDKNLGFGPAVNEVARRTSAPWIAPANADIELTPGALEAMLATGSEACVGSVAPRLITADGSTQHSVHAFPTIRLASLFAIGAYKLPGLGDRLCVEGYWRPERPREIDWAHGAFLIVRRTAWDQICGFDPAQWMYAEDIDLHWRLSRAGWVARYQPLAQVRHAVSAAATKAFGGARAQRHLLATYLWQRRTLGAATTYACALINAAGAAMRLPGAIAIRPSEARRAALKRYAFFFRAHLRGLASKETLERAVAPPR